MPVVSTWRAFLLTLLTALAFIAAAAPEAIADSGARCNRVTGECESSADSGSTNGKQGSSTPVSGRGSGGPSPEQQLAAYQRAWKSYETQLNNYRDCLDAGTAQACGAPEVMAQLTGAIGTITATPGGPPLMSPAQAGAIAVARLQLPLNAPKVGPDPKVNKWKMAAVGYPLWVWADGPTHVGPVSDSVAGLSVSLDAQLTKTVFRMGDGKSVTCTGGGTPYLKGTKAATPSPTCGYRYGKPSLPKGDYTVTAIGYWAVTWNVNGTSGVITVPRVATAPLPVGEVQVLVR